MDMIIFEDNIKYDGWVKPALIFPIFLVIGLGVMFYMDAHFSDILPNEPAADASILRINEITASGSAVPAMIFFNYGDS